MIFINTAAIYSGNRILSYNFEQNANDIIYVTTPNYRY